jgi:MFS family permease
LPVLAPLIAQERGQDPRLVGLYAALIFGAAIVSSLATPPLVARWGPLRVMQFTLVPAAAGVLTLMSDLLAGFAVSAVLIGLAYGPANPASSVLLARVTPAHLRARVFSAKQTSVPLGGVLAGALVPVLASAWSWRAAVCTVAILCLVTAGAVQPWRRRLDDGDRPEVDVRLAALIRPVTLLGRSRSLRGLAGLSGLFAAVQFCFGSVFVSYLATDGGLPLITAGAMLSLALGASIAARVLWGWAADRTHASAVLAAITVLMAVSSFATAAITPDWPRAATAIVAVLFGASAYSWNGVFLSEVARAAPKDGIGAATAGCMCVTYVGALFGPAVFSVLSARLDDGRLGFCLLGAIAIVAGVLAVRLGTGTTASEALSEREIGQ